MLLVEGHDLRVLGRQHPLSHLAHHFLVLLDLLEGVVEILKSPVCLLADVFGLY